MCCNRFLSHLARREDQGRAITTPNKLRPDFRDQDWNSRWELSQLNDIAEIDFGKGYHDRSAGGIDDVVQRTSRSGIREELLEMEFGIVTAEVGHVPGHVTVGKTDSRLFTAKLNLVSLEDAMATRTFSARARSATPKPIPDEPPMMRTDWPEMEGIWRSQQAVLRDEF